MKINKVRLGLSVLLVAIFFLILTAFFWNYVRDTFAIPIYYVLWLGDLMLKSIPQQIYLLLLVGLCLTIAINTLLDLNANQTLPRAAQATPPPFTRYRLWSNLANNMFNSMFSRQQFAVETRKLILTIVAYEEGISPSEAETLVEKGLVPVPDVIRDFVIRREIKDLPQPTSRMQMFALRLKQLFRSNQLPSNSGFNYQLTEIIGFIEEHLEITHAGNQPHS